MGREVFRLPAELIIEVLTYFGDPHRNVRREKAYRGIYELDEIVPLEHVERLTVVRKLTMTCWHLRNMLFPLLWKYIEGCRQPEDTCPPVAASSPQNDRTSPPGSFQLSCPPCAHSLH